jgi:Lrp/AsnC family transcriptional regulator for asnA, asnC and gidA
MVQIDDTDREILSILQENYRISYKQLGDKVKMAASSVHNRVQNMINTGVIKEFDTLIDPFKVGYETIALVGLSVDPLRLNEIAEQIATYEEVQLVATTTGDHDIVIRVIEKNDKELWRFINEKIKTIDGVRSQLDVSSYIDVFKMTHKIPLMSDK